MFARLPNYSMPADSDFEELPCKRSKKDKQTIIRRRRKIPSPPLIPPIPPPMFSVRYLIKFNDFPVLENIYIC